MSDAYSTEMWAAIPGYPGYEVSTEGRIRSFWQRQGGGKTIQYFVGDSPRILKMNRDRNGYMHVDLCNGSGRNGRVHATVIRLVLLAFKGEPEPGQMALHKETADKSDCRLENLRWGTRSQNNGADVVKHRGKHPNSSFAPDDVRAIRRRLAAGETQTAIARDLGVHTSTISLIARNKHHAYIEDS